NSKASKPDAKPAETAPARPSPAVRANRPAAPPAQARPMLVIPGVTGPGGRSGVTSRSATVPPVRGPNSNGVRGESPPGPATPSGARSPFQAAPAQPSQPSRRDSPQEPIPLTIEPLEDLPESEVTPRKPDQPSRTQDRPRAGTSRPA